MKKLKQKIKSMSPADLVSQANSVAKSLVSQAMALREDPKAASEIYKLRHERALIRTYARIAQSKVAPK